MIARLAKDDDWEACKGYFKSIIDLNPSYTSLGHIQAMIASEQYTMIVIEDGSSIVMAMVYEVVTCPTGTKVLMVPQVAGDNMPTWIKCMINFVYQVAKDLGCEKILIAGGRPGWGKVMKKYGGKVSYVTVEYDVQDWFNGSSTDSN